MKNTIRYQQKNTIRILTATSLFDGHDAAINIMRRIIQSTGVEVIHLGHNRSVAEIVACAVQEDVQGIAVTSYQGGHLEFFKYMKDLLKTRDCDHIKIFGGGGGVILPAEIEELHAYGITRIYSPDDGREMGLQGMINDLVAGCDFPTGRETSLNFDKVKERDVNTLSRWISTVENNPESVKEIIAQVGSLAKEAKTPVIGITGTGGAGKSTLEDEVIRRFIAHFPDKTLAVISIDPSKRKTGGALLGDRIRMNAIHSPRIFMRSLATRQSNLSVSRYVQDALNIMKVAGFDLIILETSGIGQSDTEITSHSDVSAYVMTPDYGAATQLEKIDMLDFADIIALNKFDKQGAMDALRDVKKQYQRNHDLWEEDPETLPVYGTIASRFNDPGVDVFFGKLMALVKEKTGADFPVTYSAEDLPSEKTSIIPSHRTRYLSEISETVRKYNQWAENQAHEGHKLQALKISLEMMENEPGKKSLKEIIEKQSANIDRSVMAVLDGWEEKKKAYSDPEFIFRVRNREIRIQTHTESLSHLQIPKVSLPGYKSWGEIVKWSLKENVPGEFPFAAGVFPFKRENEDPTRMFAGEGGPERTNRRFHYLSKGMKAIRLSTAFDSVTLYGHDPDIRPDIFGKIGNSGVSVACLDDLKKLYSGFDLSNPSTSVSMTINGPAPHMAAYFMNTAIDQQCEQYIRNQGLEEKTKTVIHDIYRKKGQEQPAYCGELPEGHNGLGLMLLGVTGEEVLPEEIYRKIKTETISRVRGTVQADILKEDQAQNTCLFSTDFSLKLMGDIQTYFIQNRVKNFYSVSISGYHIAEAGANPISQLAFTLANGFTYVEYYLARGLAVNDFAPNLSFFFSNGIDPEFSVIGRVARLIWAKAMKLAYGGDERSQKMKYHIQTSGRSLHAQEINFNDIRTTLQALYAIYDNCNSLHTNAYDEAITTPTEESVRRAVAIQMIINHELGLAKNQNPNQGSFIIEELTNLVEEAVLAEFDRITTRGGVLGAMETHYQRSKIQEESLYYEKLKHSGELPIMGVNTFLSSTGSPTILPGEVIRATEEEKSGQIQTIHELHAFQSEHYGKWAGKIKDAARNDANVFDVLMEASKYLSIGQITDILFQVGGQYRRNM
ncbi:MAG: methylmalonyl-CoA mutase family protein [Proteobacteria bacterium]|nr:methylmalonyl-CoA mutase family protein [Pseudomonadota bacterium]